MSELENIKQYADKLGLTFTYDDCKELVNYMTEWQIVDYKTAVWEYLDTYEGICHSRDKEFFKEATE